MMSRLFSVDQFVKLQCYRTLSTFALVEIFDSIELGRCCRHCGDTYDTYIPYSTICSGPCVNEVDAVYRIYSKLPH